MALEFGFYDSYNHDRVYNAENMNDIFEGVIRDGVYAGIGDMFAVRPSIGLQVTVGTGRAWFKSTWNKNRNIAPVNLDIPDPVYDRIDTLCIRVQKNILERRNDFFVYKGTILTTPKPPVLQNTDETFYLPLAHITVRANSEQITLGDIEMLVGRDPCPFVTSILQQTDITDLFARWEGQFGDWWQGLKDALLAIESGDVAKILLAIESKVDKKDKATDEDISLNSDIKWMTPAKTKKMIDDIVGDTLNDGVVTSFKGRKGDVTPETGDYTADQVGALPISGGTLTGNLNIGQSGSAKNLTVTGTSSLSGNTSIGGTLGVTSSSTFNGSVEMKSGVRLKGSGNYGSVLNFGDGDQVHISEPSDDSMEIKANSINFILNGGSGSSNTNFKINGVNPFNGGGTQLNPSNLVVTKVQSTSMNLSRSDSGGLYYHNSSTAVAISNADLFLICIGNQDIGGSAIFTKDYTNKHIEIFDYTQISGTNGSISITRRIGCYASLNGTTLSIYANGYTTDSNSFTFPITLYSIS